MLHRLWRKWHLHFLWCQHDLNAIQSSLDDTSDALVDISHCDSIRSEQTMLNSYWASLYQAGTVIRWAHQPHRQMTISVVERDVQMLIPLHLKHRTGRQSVHNIFAHIFTPTGSKDEVIWQHNAQCSTLFLLPGNVVWVSFLTSLHVPWSWFVQCGAGRAILKNFHAYSLSHAPLVFLVIWFHASHWGGTAVWYCYSTRFSYQPALQDHTHHACSNDGCSPHPCHQQSWTRVS